ncbi:MULTISPECIES: hypothetical protein [unclassified Streptomyces]|uniref:hypothetical protein n=1 Tax=unclassified Streptomyces TaxID=2593676 RepID=UPI00224D90AB|nr:MULTISPECIES: hypothetical protein [unclassified Streptomyces]WSP56024.1 hypothetical protein OG306_17765 [Streptomyces sp. NBC_01241]WSU23278.1 hypothetical protein OG508_21550 [Streptomyces sp. NBC_01108]MCX4787751.1 hypothetical protein [Streptomyces sp. NBC_01221]MCX4796503.1 hypothetical protein [Streptomyces sp. NBC_01242]WSJ37749.1 hypothetical protein OG772_18180 [Streptomyces sp. NBC_01321]
MSGGRKLLILLGIAFVVLSIGVTVAVRMQMRGQARKKKMRARDLYLEHLVEVRGVARQVAENQRLVAAWSFLVNSRGRTADAGDRVVNTRERLADDAPAPPERRNSPCSTAPDKASPHIPAHRRTSRGGQVRCLTGLSQLNGTPNHFRIGRVITSDTCRTS